MAGVLESLMRANLAAAAAILVVVALRRPVRARFGAEIAYGLWGCALFATLASFLPGIASSAAARLLADPAAGLDPAAGRFILAAWIGGAAAVAATLCAGQLRFLARAKAGRAGPAVVGLVSPRIVTPADYGARFSLEERAMIRAHERTHIRRGDAQANALIAGLQALFWFNPMVHLAARLARHDQELACDAAVLRRDRFPRRAYAEALLKTQLSPQALPLGCRWPAPARHPLEERVALLKAPAPTAGRALVGRAAVLSLAILAGGGVWLSKPAAPALRHRIAPLRAADPVMLFTLYRTPRA